MKRLALGAMALFLTLVFLGAGVSGSGRSNNSSDGCLKCAACTAGCAACTLGCAACSGACTSYDSYGETETGERPTVEAVSGESE